MPISRNLESLIGQYENIVVHTDCWSTIGDGWLSLVEETMEKLSFLGAQIEIHQIKEKFGELNIYYSLDSEDDDLNEHAFSIVSEATIKSREVCEVCGAPGERSSRYSDGSRRFWIKTLCDNHNVKEK